MTLGWRDSFKKLLISSRFQNLYFYLTNDGILYTASSAYITEIRLKDITKLSIKRGLFKRSFHIRLNADKKYHLLVNDIKDFSTALTSDGADNVENFIRTLKEKVNSRW